MRDNFTNPSRDEQATDFPRPHPSAGEILTFRACLLSGRAARLLRLYRDRVTEEDFELLDELAHTPGDLVFLSSPEEALERIEQELGAPKLDPDAVERHALALLWSEYKELIRRIGESLDPCGLELVVDPDADKLKPCITDRELAQAWFERALNEAINNEGDEDHRGGLS
jgi:hypothetical protein